MIKHLSLVAALILSTTNVRAEPSLMVTAERLGKLPWAWHSLKVAVRIKNVSAKAVSLKPPFIGIRVGDPWTTIDFLVERGGVQFRRRYRGAYTAEFGVKTVTLKPGETSEPVVFDLQEDESNWSVYWSTEADSAGTFGKDKFWARLPFGRYTIRMKFFNPVDTKKLEAGQWRGEITSEPFSITII